MDGRFDEAREAVRRGEGDRTDFDQGANAYMSRTLPPESYQKWNSGAYSDDIRQADNLAFWAERENL